MGFWGRFRLWFEMEEDRASLPDRPGTHSWLPIGTAPSGEHVLLGWSSGNDEFDWLIAAGALVDGRWLDGPGPQPNVWMREPEFSRRRSIGTAPDNEALVLIWEDEEFYSFDVGELSDGFWPDGPIQPTGWIPVDQPPVAATI